MNQNRFGSGTPQNSVEIIDGNGWRKEFPLEKSLIHVGSDPRNDLVLDPSRGAGVAARHLQLIAIPGEVQRYRAINLGETDILWAESAEYTIIEGDRFRTCPEGRRPREGGMDPAAADAGAQILAPRSILEIAPGQSLRLGTFTLVFRLPFDDAAEYRFRGGVARSEVSAEAAIPANSAGLRDDGILRRQAEAPGAVSGPDQASDVISLRLSLPDSVLGPEHSLEGIVTVRNLGNQPGAQFRLQVLGLEPDCYEIGPGPILFPNVEKGVFLRLDHPRRPDPPAGRHQIRIRSTAPEAYPGESATVSRDIVILPYFRHSLQIVPVDQSL